MTDAPTDPVYGLMAEFDNPTDLLHATERAYAAGYRKMDAYSPYPIEELADALDFTRRACRSSSWSVAISADCRGYVLQYWINGDQLSAERRRAPVQFVAGLHHRDL